MKRSIQVVMLLMFAALGVHAKVRYVKKDGDFTDALNNKKYVVAVFVAEDDIVPLKGMSSSELKTVKKSLKAVSNESRYAKVLRKEVGFYVVELTKKYAEDFIKSYDLKDIPTAVIFKNGAIVKQGKSDKAVLTKVSSKADLLEFIDEYIGSDLDDIVDKKEEDERLRKEESIARNNATAAAINASWGWGSPYYDYWGWGWGRPYYRRPGFGFSVVV